MSNVSEMNVNQQFLNCSELDYVCTDLMLMKTLKTLATTKVKQ